MAILHNNFNESDQYLNTYNYQLEGAKFDIIIPKYFHKLNK